MDNENNIENIKAKIKKLLALSKSDNENEAFIALKKANDLISQYKLDEDSLFFELVKVKATKTYVDWQTLISNAVAWLYGCYSYRNCSHGMKIFIGESLDAFLAGEMFTYIIKTINRCAKKSIRKNAKFKFRHDFKYGMADRIHDRIMELGESCSWSPNRDIKIEKAKYFIEKSIKLTFDEGKNIKLNNKAFFRGSLYGDGVSLARQTGHTPILQLQ